MSGALPDSRAAATTQHSPRIRLRLATQLKGSQLQDLSPELQAAGANRIGSESRRRDGDGGLRPKASQVLSNLTPYIPNFAKFCSVLCSLDRLTSLSTSGPKWMGKVGPGPRTPRQAHSACLQRRVTHCSPGPELPFLVLSTTRPHPELRVL